MSQHSRVPPDTSLRVLVEGLADQDGAMLSNATVRVTALRRRASASNVEGVTLPITLLPVADSPGDYEAIIGADNGLQRGQWYVATIEASHGGLTRTWTEDIYVTRGKA